MQKKKATGTTIAAESSSMKRNLDTGVEEYNNKEKKEQRHTTDEKPDIYLNYFMKTNILTCETDLFQSDNQF